MAGPAILWMRIDSLFVGRLGWSRLGYVRTAPRRSRLHPSEDHSAGRILEYTGDGNGHFLVQVRFTLLHDHHRAVFEVANPLPGLVPRLDNPHRERLARQRHRLERVGNLV